MDGNSIFKILSDFSNSYVEKIQKNKNDNDTNTSLLCNRKEAALHNSKVNIENLYIKNEYNCLSKQDMFNKHTAVEPLKSNISNNLEKPEGQSGKKLGSHYVEDTSGHKLRQKMASKMRHVARKGVEQMGRENVKQNVKEKMEQKIRSNAAQKMVSQKMRQHASEKTGKDNVMLCVEPKDETHVNEQNKDTDEEKYLCSPNCSAEWYEKNMYSNYYLLNKSCSYLKSKCVRETIFDSCRIRGGKRIIENNLVNVYNKNDVKNSYTCVQNYPYDSTKMSEKRSFHFKMNKEKNTFLGKSNDKIYSDILLYSNEYDDGKYPDKLEIHEFGKCTYDILNECECKNSSKYTDKTICDEHDGSFLEIKEFSENEKRVNISDINNFNMTTYLDKYDRESYFELNKPLSNNTSQLMKIKLLTNKKKNSSHGKNGRSPFSDYKNRNTFVKFLMAEIKIEVKLYKLILFVFILIVLSLFKDMSNYIVITRKCYNIYENPIKSIKRVLKYIIIALKIGYKFSSPLILYMLSFFCVIILRIFMLLNIPILLLLLYCKYHLKNEQPTLKLYFIFLLNMYKYVVFQFVQILKNYFNPSYLNGFMSFICVSFRVIFIYIYKIIHKIYIHKVC
ncbi:hypothetical protein, conserved [Plasmodium gonderi]|uniref:Uncharacterized protein n=1 Tax=Plasmodium gonderi TaxID=77519 RepID=A0A1Y1JKW0_PLAGO|nr:hypothetical protein, conserved [Plasmodium gonderi]GAW80674.1 hypothetical protein, conserved [Plasmodium gonderi]